MAFSPPLPSAVARAGLAAARSPHHARGRERYARGDLAGALACFERALTTQSDHPGLLYDLARVARDLGNLDGAEMLLRRVLELQPLTPEVANALALVLATKGQCDAAITLLAPVLEIYPDEARLQCTMASLHQRGGDFDRASAFYAQALQLEPNLVEAHANLALVHAERNDFTKALTAAERAVTLAPKNADARFNLATIRLALGEFARAWPDYEARFAQGEGKTHGAVRRPFSLPNWKGEPLGPRPLLLWGEQGVGEEIMFAALIPEAARRSDRVVVECDARLVPLLSRSFAAIEPVARTTPPDARTRLEDGAMQCALGSLCGHFRRDAGAFHGHSGYLRPDPARVAAFQAQHRALGANRVIGLSWRTKDMRNGKSRTTQLADWLPILRLPGVTFVDLQYGDTAAEREALQRDHGIVVHHDDNVEPLRDLDAQAAQIAALDLVVTVQNATMYLANAVGAPVWALLPHYRDWRWPVGSTTSPWLPTVRPFTQAARGDWNDTIQHIAAALADGKTAYA